MKKIVRYTGEPDSLELVNDKDYEVISVEHGRYRIVDETGDDYLFPKVWFEIL